MNIDYLHLPWENRLLADFYQSFDRSFVSTLFTYNPWREDSFRQRYQYLQKTRSESFPRRDLIKVFRAQYGRARIHPQIETNLKRLEDQRSCVVIGGQQAGLLTGPLYTLYKAITIIQLAQREEKRLGVPVIPVFWIAGEDHDFDEVNHIWIRDAHEQVKKQIYHLSSSRSFNRISVSHLTFDRSRMLEWLIQLSNQFPDTPYKDEWLRMSEAILSSVQTWGQFFFRMMQALFSKWGLLLIDSTNIDLRRLESKFFIRLIKENPQLRKIFLETNHNCQKNQYHTHVKILGNHSHLFIYIHGERYPLFHSQDRWITGEGFPDWSTEELLRMAEESPEMLSNNVLSRPLMQEYLFPTLAFVGGPSEIAYWSLLRRAFERMDLEMPIVYPRVQITLVDQTSSKRMRHFQFTWKDLFMHFEQKKREWLHEKVNLDIDQLFQKTSQEINQIHQSLIDQLEKHLPMHLGEIGEKNREKLNAQLRYLRNYVQRIVAEQYQTELRRMNEIVVRLFPLQRPQERVFNLIQFWNEHGLQWLDQLIQQPLLSRPNFHHLVHI